MASRVVSPVPAASVGRRIGQFAVGAFAGLCAAFIPRLALMVGQRADSATVTVDAFSATYIVAAFAFSFLIGGVAVILEWEGDRSPRDTFMAALGIPAILTGMFNTADASRGAVDLAERLKSINDERARQENILVDEENPQSSAAPTRWWLPEWHLVPVVLAAEPSPAGMTQKPGGSKIGVVYREPRYWVVLHTASTKQEAERRAADLRPRYGQLTIERVDNAFFVCLAGGSLYYSEAVSRAVEVKRRSQGAMTPKLVRAD
jgi:hypothetical protein